MEVNIAGIIFQNEIITILTLSTSKGGGCGGGDGRIFHFGGP